MGKTGVDMRTDLQGLAILPEELADWTGVEPELIGGWQLNFDLDQLLIVRPGYFARADIQKKYGDAYVELWMRQYGPNPRPPSEVPAKPRILPYWIAAVLSVVVLVHLFLTNQGALSDFWMILVSLLFLVNIVLGFASYKRQRLRLAWQAAQARREHETFLRQAEASKQEFLKRLRAKEPTRLGILLDNVDTYNQAITKTVKLLHVSDQLVAVGNPRAISETDREKVLATYHALRADLARALKTDRIWRENPQIQPEDFDIPASATTVREELSAQASEYQELVNEAFRIATSVQAQMESLQGHSSPPKERREAERLAGFREQAGLCARLERGPPDEREIHRVRVAWLRLSHPVDDAMRKRWEWALSMAPLPPRERRFEDGALARRKRLCVAMEVLAELPSPREDIPFRLKLVKERASSLGATTHGKASSRYLNPLAEAWEWERQWYLAPAVAETEAIALDQRFEAARQAVRDHLGEEKNAEDAHAEEDASAT